MNEDIRAKIHRLVDIALDTNGIERRARHTTGTLPTIFFNFSGHVGGFDMHIHRDGWSVCDHAETLCDFYLENGISDEKIDIIEERCRAALEDKKESDVLRRDIEKRSKGITEDKKGLALMRKELKKLEKEGR